ncbi:MAG: FAD/NAD(P)-binding protein [bacterium]|nr:FAD/NAD(P)-binding protein [bacterium]
MNPESVLTPTLWKLLEVQEETGDCFSLRLEPPEGYRFEPGQFNMLYAFGKGEAPISISSDPDRSDQLVHSIRAVGVVTQELQRLRAGEQVGVRGPFGQPWPLEEAEGKEVLIIAGGIGLAPLRPLIYRILAQRQRFKQVYLLYGARTPKDLLYPDQLELWQEGIEVRTTVDRSMAGWTGQVGVVPRLITAEGFDPANTLAFVCGPEVMMNFCVEELQNRGVAGSSIFVSLERNMKCAQGYCGHCQMGPYFICRDGPVFRYERIQPFLNIRGG